MHSEDGEEDLKGISAYYGVAPSVLGVLAAAGIIWFMFKLADGFA